MRTAGSYRNKTLVLSGTFFGSVSLSCRDRISFSGAMERSNTHKTRTLLGLDAILTEEDKVTPVDRGIPNNTSLHPASTSGTQANPTPGTE